MRLNKKDFLINAHSTQLITELITEGWEFLLHFGDHTTGGYTDIEGNTWEANFTKKLPEGFRDNYKIAYSKDINSAIHQAYNYVKEGVKM